MAQAADQLTSDFEPTASISVEGDDRQPAADQLPALSTPVPTLARVRTWLLGLLALELVATLVDLLLLNHYEDPTQLIPLILIALTLLLFAWHVARPGPASVRIIKVLMCAFVLAGLAGVGLHLLGAAQFQREIDPAQSAWTLFQKALRAQAPPALAPGVMLQMGLLGLVYAYRHPSSSFTE